MNDETILLVDDDPSLLRVTEFQLKKTGLSVITAMDGEKGLECFCKHKPEIVVTDVKMPKLDGLQLLVEIKKRSLSAHVIVITAHSTLDTAIQAMKTGAFDYLIKPFEKDELIVTVQKALEYHQIGFGSSIDE